MNCINLTALLHLSIMRWLTYLMYIVCLHQKIILFHNLKLIHNSPSIIDTLVITSQLVSSKLNNLISGKSLGTDGWPTELLKSTAELICLPLYLYNNKSLSCGALPDDRKIAFVAPLHKKVPETFFQIIILLALLLL